MQRRRMMLVLLVAFAATFAHHLVLIKADSQGLLLQTLSATESRQRSRDNPNERENESRALELANMAIAEAALPTRRVSFELETLPTPALTTTSASFDAQTSFLQGVAPLALAPRAPPHGALAPKPQALPILQSSSLLVFSTGGISHLSAAPRAPPAL